MNLLRARAGNDEYRDDALHYARQLVELNATDF